MAKKKFYSDVDRFKYYGQRTAQKAVSSDGVPLSDFAKGYAKGRVDEIGLQQKRYRGKLKKDGFTKKYHKKKCGEETRQSLIESIKDWESPLIVRNTPQSKLDSMSIAELKALDDKYFKRWLPDDLFEE